MGRFVTAQQVRDWTGDPDLPEARLNLLIPAAEDAVESYCGREFSPDNGKQRSIAYDGNGYLDLSPWELRNLTSIEWDVGVPGTYRAAEASEYVLRGRTRQGTWLWLALARVRRYGEPLFDPLPRNLGWTNVRITGDWGCAAVPNEVVTATLIVITNQLENPSSAQTRGVGGVEFQEGEAVSSSHIPDDAKGWLEGLTRDSGIGVG